MNDKARSQQSRRQFIRGVTVAAVALPAAAMLGMRSEKGSALRPAVAAQEECEWCGAMDAPANPPPRTVISPPNETGEPLVISGTIYNEDGRTPAPGILIYAYHTNARGIYPKRTPDNGRAQWRHGYLRGWMRTNRDGKYEFRTIKPAAYPGRTEPAHIHMTISGASYPEYSDTIWFADDPLLTPGVRAANNAIATTRATRRAAILTLTRDRDGLLRGTHDLKLERFTA